MKHYPAEFKADAVELYRSRPGATIKSVASDLGVNTETLRNWIRAADGRRSGAHSARVQEAQQAVQDIGPEDHTHVRRTVGARVASAERTRGPYLKDHRRTGQLADPTPRPVTDNATGAADAAGKRCGMRRGIII
ncbi:transposase [Streptomyces sp. XH2]|uniref:transposase n=1 Tax=Streptomyces sp. XH2 TaxID=3412483 RepID=UPI003C7C8058